MVADSWNRGLRDFHLRAALSLSDRVSRNSLVTQADTISSIPFCSWTRCKSLPPKYYLLLRINLQVLAERFDTYNLTCTATQPLIYEHQSYIELSPDQLFEHPVFNRVKLFIHKDPCELEDFAQRVELEGIVNALFVMNTKRSAIDLLPQLQERYG